MKWCCQQHYLISRFLQIMNKTKRCEAQTWLKNSSLFQKQSWWAVDKQLAKGMREDADLRSEKGSNLKQTRRMSVKMSIQNNKWVWKLGLRTRVAVLSLSVRSDGSSLEAAWKYLDFFSRWKKPAVPNKVTSCWKTNTFSVLADIPNWLLLRFLVNYVAVIQQLGQGCSDLWLMRLSQAILSPLWPVLMRIERAMWIGTEPVSMWI